MRVSIEIGDPACTPESWIRTQGTTIYLDGVLQKLCITADEEEGMVVRYKMNPNGTVYVNAKGMCERETVYGKVVIHMPEDDHNGDHT